jgi:hypothetical protein
VVPEPASVAGRLWDDLDGDGRRDLKAKLARRLSEQSWTLSDRMGAPRRLKSKLSLVFAA